MIPFCSLFLGGISQKMGSEHTCILRGGPGEWKSARCALGTAFGTSAANINITTKDIELKL